MPARLIHITPLYVLPETRRRTRRPHVPGVPNAMRIVPAAARGRRWSLQGRRQVESRRLWRRLVDDRELPGLKILILMGMLILVAALERAV